MKLSIVTTLYESEPYITEFYDRIRKQAESITDDYELIIVDDGSPDASLIIAKDLMATNPRIKIVELSRNFGHHKAIMAGLAFSSGELIFLIDSDLEESPELLGEFYREMLTSKVDVVFGVQRSRKGGVSEKLGGRFFYLIFNMLSETKITPNLASTRLMTRNYVDALVQHREREIFLAGLMAITGFKQKALQIDKHSKPESTYTLRRRIQLLVSAITSFSNFPLKAVFYAGSAILMGSIGGIVYLFYRKLFLGIPIAGYTSIIISIWFLGGLSLFSIGIVGIYLGKIFIEVKRRPNTVIRAVHCQNEYSRSTETSVKNGFSGENNKYFNIDSDR